MSVNRLVSARNEEIRKFNQLEASVGTSELIPEEEPKLTPDFVNRLAK